jgi:hypothetical protein
MPDHALVRFLQAINLTASALLTIKLYKSGLFRHYPVFFCYFVFRVPNSLWSIFLEMHSNAYFYCWVLTSPIVWTFYILIVRELYGLVLVRHRGIATLGRWAMYAGTAVSVTISILTLLPKFTPSTTQASRIIGYLYATERGVTLCLALLLILMLLFLSRYPVPLGRNVLVHATLYTLFFLGNSLTGLLRSVFGITLYTALDTALMVGVAACIFAWLFLLTPQGERAQVQLPSYNAEHERRFLHHLDALNSTLLKAGRD